MSLDLIGEIYVSMSRNKLRIALTGFSIAWGIFMLIVLLGAGNGLLHGMASNFASSAVNTICLWPGQTTKAENGLPKYREIYFDVNDVEFLRKHFPKEVSAVQPIIESSDTIAVGTHHITSSLTGVYPEYIETGDFVILKGRSLNEIDIREHRKVCMLQEASVEKLFDSDEDCVGKWVKIGKLEFRVVGIFKRTHMDRDESPMLPLTTMATIFAPNQHYSEVKLLVQNLNTADENEAFDDAIRAALAERKHFSKDDHGIWIWNQYTDYLQTQSIMKGLRLFIWFIGIATLIAGVTGISNIMLITVRERTHEFGIRKALGARPREIVSLVLWESVAITLVFGYLGMFFGIGLTQIADYVLSMNSNPDEPSPITNPTVDLSIVLMATLTMVIAGLIAGYIPAKRAVSIKPVEALAEN